MSPFEQLLQASRQERAVLWHQQCQNCQSVQEAVLLDILHKAAHTEIGQTYHFAEIDTVEAYCRDVPVMTYDDIAPLVERMVHGESDVLFDKKAKVFLQSSGTTGEPKLIPESQAGYEVKHLVQDIRELYSAEVVLACLKQNPQFAELAQAKGWPEGQEVSRAQAFTSCHIFSVASAAKPQKPQQAQVTFASGQSVKKKNTASLLAYPMEVLTIADNEAMMYLMMMFALRLDDVLEIAGSHIGRALAMLEYTKDHAREMIEDIKMGHISQRINLTQEQRQMLAPYLEAMPQRAEHLEKLLEKGDFSPRAYWPYLSGGIFWLTGSSGRYLTDLLRWLPESVTLFEVGYGASEAKINIPTTKENGTGALAAFAGFFEFIDTATDEIYRAWEVEVGKTYTLLLTTYSGLYRYNLHDVVRIDGFLESMPQLTFLLREGDILSIGQEKFPADLLYHYVEEVVPIRVCQIWQDIDNRRYEIYIEPKEAITDLEALAGELDDYLQQQFAPYSRYRQFHVIAPSVLKILPQGYMEKIRGCCDKIPLVLPKALTDGDIVAL